MAAWWVGSGAMGAVLLLAALVFAVFRRVVASGGAAH
jgi:hypothetical protein